MKQLSLGERPEPCNSITPKSTSSQPTTTIEYPPPAYSEVDSAPPADSSVERSIDHPQELSPPSNVADGLSTSGVSQPSVKEARNDQLSADMPIHQAMQEDIPTVPPHNDVPIGHNVNTSSASIATVLGSRKRARNIKPHREPNDICPYDIRSWRFRIRTENAETGAPDICWCSQCFQSESPLDNRICFGTSDGYVEVWTDKAKAATFSWPPSFCSCKTLPFYLETVTKYDFYRDSLQKLRDNSPKRKYLLGCRSFYILSTKDSKFRNIESGSARISSGKSLLRTPPSGHLRQSSAPENNAHLLGESPQSANRANHDMPEIRGPPKSSSDVRSLTQESKPAQFNVSINPESPVLPKEICWCGDFCWVTKVRRARTDQSDIRHECRSRTEIGHRVFFSSAGGEIEVWTDLPKPKNAFTGVEKPTCEMAPRHISTVIEVDISIDRLTQSAPKRVHLLMCRELSEFSSLGSQKRIATLLAKQDTKGNDDVPAPKDRGLHEEGGRQIAHATRREESPNFLSSSLLQPPQIGHQRRSSAPEALEKKTEPLPLRSRAKYYRLANGKTVTLRMPPGDISNP